ncbi:DUF3108 domain-containing protein [Marinomonas epiphytica]
MVTQRHRKILLASCLFSIWATLPSHANTPTQEDFLPPYSATYSTVWKKGISVKVEGKQTLTRQANDLWEFKFTADSFIASLKESSVFKVIDHQIVPEKYRYESQVFGKKKTAELTFDWQNQQVLNDIKDKPWYLSIPKNTLDKLSIQLQVREDLKQGKREFDYRIADGGYIKNWRFKREKRETIKTSLGRLPTIKVTRIDNLDSGKRTYFWFAPKYDYLLVKLEHKDDGETYRLDLDTLTTTP